tara:strand:- start:530 stop:823 length:294 start_codon:yes stop_codon:yes gene_type:complete
MEFHFKIAAKVRDYDLGIQGVTNNAAYLNYCEHIRHEFLLHKGIDFAASARQNINLMVAASAITAVFASNLKAELGSHLCSKFIAAPMTNWLFRPER